MPLLDFTKDNFDDKVLKSKKPVLVYFWAKWCPPCRMASPIIDELADEYQDKALVGKVNVDKDQELSQKYGVMSIPTVVILKEGKEVNRKVGFPGKESYEEMIKEALK